MRVTALPRMPPMILPSTITRSPATIPLTLPRSLTTTSGAGHITFKLAIDLYLALADNLHALACKLQVFLDHHSAPIRHDAYPYFLEKEHDCLPSKIAGGPDPHFSRVRQWII